VRRSFLTVADLSVDELGVVLDLAAKPAADLGAPLRGKGVALLFEKPSNRTRQSMEVAVFELGGHPVYTRGEEVGFDVREPVEDIAAVMSGYHAVLAARVFLHSTVERLAAAATVPVVNMLSDHAHPLQALADVLTMSQLLGPLAGRTVAWVGDYNNVARSLAEAAVMLGMHVRIAAPDGFDASSAELERISLLGDGTVAMFRRAEEAVKEADAVHTDTWVSMGQEHEKAARVQVFESYRVDSPLMSLAADDALFFHCLPAYRGMEVAADVLDGPRSRVVQQAHNRLHASRALLAFLVGANQ
jgi:ornithine carbamoyltransferase